MNARRVSLIITAIIVVLLALPLVWLAPRLLNPTSDATLKLNVTQTPADDAALQQWLASQPDLSKTSVQRTPPTVTVLYTAKGYSANDLAPKIAAESKQVGYAVNGYSVSSNGSPVRDIVR